MNIHLDLKYFEKKYNLSSDDFYFGFNDGGFNDREEYMPWAGICEMLLDNESRKALGMIETPPSASEV